MRIAKKAKQTKYERMVEVVNFRAHCGLQAKRKSVQSKT